MFHSNEIVNVVLFLTILIPSIVLHEVAHGWVAERFGDPTARDAGRITLNPIPHIDPMGSLIVPGLLAFSGSAVVGWARPVPVNPARLRRPGRDMAIVGLAGPATNLLIAAVLARIGRFTVDATCSGFGPATNGICLGAGEGILTTSLWARVMLAAILLNVALGLFNLLPIPPLDGSRLLLLVLPENARSTYHRIAPYGFLLLFLLVFVVPDGLGFLWNAIAWVMRLLI